MFYSKSVVVFATLFATFSEAVPVSENLEVTPRKLQTISITQVQNKKHHKAPGPVALAKAVKKYGGVLSHELSAAVTAVSTSG
jgi:type II secretory pathway component PulF